MNNTTKNIEIGTMPIMRGVVNSVNNKALGIYSYDESNDQFVIYDLKKGVVEKHFRAAQNQRPILYSDNKRYSRAISYKGAFFLSVCKDDRGTINHCSVEVYDKSTFSKLCEIPISNLFNWKKGYRVADAVRIDNVDIIACIQEDIGVEDKIILLKYDETDNNLRIIDVIEAANGTFDNLKVSENGENLNVDLLKKNRYDEPYYYEERPLHFKLNLEREEAKLFCEGVRIDYKSWMKEHGYLLTQRRYFLGIQGELSIIRERDKKTIFSHDLKRLDKVYIQPINELQILLVHICGNEPKTFVANVLNNDISIVGTLLGEPLSITLDREHAMATIEYINSTAIIKRLVSSS